MKEFCVFLFLITFFQSCETARNGNVYKYRYKLINVGSQNRECSMVENCKIFEDDKIHVKFHLKAKQIEIELFNKTEIPLKIIWDESVLIVNNESKKIFHGSTKLIDAEKGQTNTFIAPRTFINDVLVEYDKLYWYEGYITKYSYSPSGWRIKNRFPVNDYSDSNIKKDILERIGNIFTLYLTIDDGTQKIHYPFNFEIVDIQKVVD